MYNRRVKFVPKIFNRLGKNVRKPQGGNFLTHTEYLGPDSFGTRFRRRLKHCCIPSKKMACR